MTSTLSEPAPGVPFELLRGMLEEAFAVHTTRLTEVTVCGRLPDRGGHDAGTLELLAAHHRQGIADAARALRRMADGSYGICPGCDRPIPLGRLRAMPHTEHCGRCADSVLTSFADHDRPLSGVSADPLLTSFADHDRLSSGSR